MAFYLDEVSAVCEIFLLYIQNVTEYGAHDIQPITIQDSVNRNLTLLAVAMETTSESRFLQPAMVSAQADFIPRFVCRKLYSFNKSTLFFWIVLSVHFCGGYLLLVDYLVRCLECPQIICGVQQNQTGSTLLIRD